MKTSTVLASITLLLLTTSGHAGSPVGKNSMATDPAKPPQTRPVFWDKA